MKNKKIIAAIIAAVLASLCCVTPVLALLAGVGSVASTFAWLEPYHNYLVVLTLLILGYAWWDKLKPRKEEIDCACDEQGATAFFSSKKFLGIVTFIAIVLLSFPIWGYKYFKVEEGCTTCVTDIPKPTVKVAQPKVEKLSAKSEKQVEKPKSDLNAKLIQKYLNEEKANPTFGLGMPACSGIGYKEADDLFYYAKQDIIELPVSVLKKMIDNDEDMILLDVREAEQRAEGVIYAAESYAMTRGNLEFRIMNVLKDKDAIIVAYCRSGGRSAFAAQTLKKLGYKNAVSLKGGLKEWALSGYPFDNGFGVVVQVKPE